MNELNRKISLYFILILVAFHNKNLYAVKKNIEDFDKLLELKKEKFSELFQNTLQTIKDGRYTSKISLDYIKNFAYEEIKQIESTITPDDDMFDSWITFILSTFPKDPNFVRNLKTAKQKGKSERATPAAQTNLGYMYLEGQGVNRDVTKAIKLYKKAAAQGFATAQTNLGLIYYLGLDIDLDLVKAIKLYKKAAKQGDILAQNSLGSIYRNGTDVDQDLLQSLKWYLECLKNVNTDLNIKDNSKDNILNLVTFLITTLTPEDEKNLKTNQEMLKDNVEKILGLHGLEKGVNVSYDSEKGVNQPTLSFKEGKFAIPAFFKNYSKIVDFEEFLLKFIPAFDQSGFMVTCLQPNDVEAFKSSKSSDIKYHEVQGQSFLTFGQDNIKTADMFMTIFDTAHHVYGAISDILGVLTKIQKSFQTGIQLSDPAQDLKNQYESRLKLGSKNQPSDPMKALTRHKALNEKVEQEIEVLTQLQAIPQQLADLLIEGASVRNKLFLQNNDYIEPIFKD